MVDDLGGITGPLRPEDELKVLRLISETVSSSLDLDQVLNRIIEIVNQVMGGDSCFLYLLNREGDELVLMASKNPHPGILGKIKLHLGEGITGWVAMEKKPVAIARDASRDPRFKFFQDLPEDRYQAFLSVPIVSKGEVIGVINVQHMNPHRHSSNEVALLSMIAQQVGSAIENARLYEETRRRLREIESLVEVSRTIVSGRYLEEMLQLISVTVMELMSSRMCSIMMLDEGGEVLVTKAIQGLSREHLRRPRMNGEGSISGRAVKEKRPVFVPDVKEDRDYAYPELARREGLCSMLSVPMIVRGRVLGVINVYTSERHHFTENEVKILQGVANQAAVAIENTKLIEEAAAMRETLEARKLVERAKGILMTELGMSEEEAYRTIQRRSMDTSRPMKEIAEAIILTMGIKRK